MGGELAAGKMCLPPPHHPGRNEQALVGENTQLGQSMGMPLCLGCKGSPWDRPSTSASLSCPGDLIHMQGGLSFSKGAIELLAKTFLGLQSLLMISSVHHHHRRHPQAAGPSLASSQRPARPAGQASPLAPSDQSPVWPAGPVLLPALLGTSPSA